MDFLSALLASSGALLHSTFVAATPLLLAALGEVVVERAGVINIGLEGILLAGAFAGMAGSYWSGSPSIGLVLGGLSGIVLALLFAWLTIGLGADQIVVGISLNLLAVGLTGVLYRGLFGVTGQALTVTTFPTLSLPLVGDAPFIGPVLFQHTALVYLALFLVPVVGFFLSHTRAGLQLQAVGEHPQAAETLGISVAWLRSSAITWNRLSTSRSVSDAVGSSMMTIRAWAPIALAISTICCSGMLSVATVRSGSIADPARPSNSRARALRAFQFTLRHKPPDSSASAMFSATVRSGNSAGC